MKPKNSGLSISSLKLPQKSNADKAMVDVFSSAGDAFECPVCMDTCEDPIKNTCGHYICMQCETTIMQSAFAACSICKAVFSANFKPMVDRQFQNEIRKATEEFEYRKEELLDKGLYQVEGNIYLKLVFGNHYEPINNPKGAYSN
jgi:hypothetical protein